MTDYVKERPLDVKTVVVAFPSGTTFTVTGVLTVTRHPEHGILPLVDTGGEIIVLDPRALVSDKQTETLLYSPRAFPSALHARWCRQWLKEHPGWASTRGGTTEAKKERNTR